MARILIAEDNPADVYLLREAIIGPDRGISQANDVELIVVSDGEQALDYVQRKGRYSAAVIPDLVVLDLNLPKSDGSEVLRGIRQITEYANVPVIVFTSSASPRDRQVVENLGATSYITKPSDLDAFLSIGQTLIDFARRSGKASRAAAAIPHAP